jgi:hypothetical protein
MPFKPDTGVVSSIGRVTLDNTGSPVAVVRVDAARCCTGFSELLKECIDTGAGDSWANIKTQIDYQYTAVESVMACLNAETSFQSDLISQVKKDKTLLFKPNLVVPGAIDLLSHRGGVGYMASTHWTFIAALMRWFHDYLDVTYHQMAVGEAATRMSATAVLYNRILGKPGAYTTEAVIEGKSGEFCGGWGLYFVRKYLAETHPGPHRDDPMNGYAESVAGTYIPPGRATDKMMVYDLNKLTDRKRGREVPVPGGANFKSVTLHKVLIGGEPGNPDDLKDYPGCVLINVPKLRVHGIDIITNAVKNIGIGLYPMELTDDGIADSTKWKYAYPFRQAPGMKAELPHAIWVPEMDEKTGLPQKDGQGEYKVTKTTGLKGTMADVIEAVNSQGTYTLHVSDAIEMSPFAVAGGGQKDSSGYIIASLDPVALDTFCMHYMFKTVPMDEARKVNRDQGLATEFLQKVPVPESEGQNIKNGPGYDTPVTRCRSFRYAEERGLGRQKYYVVGKDITENGILASVGGHFGKVNGREFSELIAGALTYSALSLPLYLQKTIFAYLKTNDRLTGSRYYEEMMLALDENNDGVIDFDETGKKGYWKYSLRLDGTSTHLDAMDEFGFLKGQFMSRRRIKYAVPEWNAQGHDFCRPYLLSSACTTAFAMSQSLSENRDALFPEITWGKGKWPSMQLAIKTTLTNSTYGVGFPDAVDPLSLYGFAFQYAEKKYWGNKPIPPDVSASFSEKVRRYAQEVSAGRESMAFTLYVPEGFGHPTGASVPHVTETRDPAKVFTALFNNGQESW